MSQIYAKALLVLGLIGVSGSTGSIALVGLSHGALMSPPAYYVAPEGGPAHKQGCPYVNWHRGDLVKLPGVTSAATHGLCEHCVSGAQAPPVSQPRVAAGTR